jgi:hypothetical protein
MGKKQVSKRRRASRDCTRKTRFTGERNAAQAATKRGMRHYYCRKCGGWHLTSTPF